MPPLSRRAALPLLLLAALLATPAGALRAGRLAGRAGRAVATRATSEEWDAVVIGSGIGGLSCASVLSASGKKVLVLEAHEHAGGAAHEWGVKGFKFESGPSLYAGLSPKASPNPLKHVFQIIGEEPEWLTYDRWGTALPEGQFAAAVGAEDFVKRILPKYGGPHAVEEWARLMKRLDPLGTAIFGLPSAAVREDVFGAVTLGRYLPALVSVVALGGQSLSKSFSSLLDEEGIQDPFVRNWLDMLCFLLQGATTKDAPTTLMAYMLSDFYRDGVVLDYPRGGTKSIIDALIRGVTKGQGQVRLNSRVKRVLNEGGLGVELESGQVVRAKNVVSNCDVWTTRKLIAGTSEKLEDYFDKQIGRVDQCGSFLHLHLGIRGDGLPTEPSEAFPAQWATVSDWTIGIDAPRNLVLVSVPSLLDPSLAPTGSHVVHAYVPATEPWADWEAEDYPSKSYREKKKAAVEVLFAAIEKYIPDVRSRVDLEFAATPRTHARFLRREKGTYGAFLPAQKDTTEMLMGHKTPLPGFYVCGDSTFPGIGVPAVAASGLITAHSILSPQEHWANLDKIKIFP